MNAVNIVTANNILDYSDYKVPVLGNSRIKIKFSAIADKTLRMFVIYMSGGQLLSGRGGHSVRVKPCVEFHAACMTFPDHELKRIPIRTRSLAAVGKKTAPRFKAAFIESIGLRAHLKDNGIDTGEAQAVELPTQIFLIGFGGICLVLGLVYGVHPCATEFTLGVQRC